MLWEQKIKPMLAKIAKPFDSKDFIFEIKFDGTRCIAYVDKKNKSCKFLNRRMLWFEHRYPELEIWKDIKEERAILDGEIVVFEKGKPNFYLLAEREHVNDKSKIEILSKKFPATFVCFDIIFLNNRDLLNLELMERKRILEQTIKESSRILISRYVEESGKNFFEEAKKKGLEGIMAKRKSSFYQIGKRSEDWLKIKALKSMDVVICGYTIGEGWREKYFGSLICGAYYKGKLRYVGKVGTGLDEKGYLELTKRLKLLENNKNPFENFEESQKVLKKIRWVKPVLVCEVSFLELTKDLKMRAPSFKRLREDKLPKECEIEDIF